MFVQNKCLVQYCKNNALSTFDQNGNITEGKGYCLDHIPNPGIIKEQIYNYIINNETIMGLNVCGLVFTDIDLSNKHFIGCNFTHCTFSNIRSENTKMQMCIFDNAIFNDCNFVKCYSIFSSFSQSTFTHTLFTASDMIQDNFNGIKAYQSSFDDSDFFNSRFIKATLVDTSLRNCNLKRTDFKKTVRVNVSFKMSNTREAIFDESGTELESGHAQTNESLSNSSYKGANV